MFRTFTIAAFAVGVMAAPAWAGAGCGSATTAQTPVSLEVAQADHAGQSTPQTPTVETSSE
jgi:hypothetical protein